MAERCNTCRFWSEMIAEAGGHSMDVRALCLNAQSPKSNRMTSERETCPKHAPGIAVDDPSLLAEEALHG